MAGSEKTWIDDSAPTCAADDLNGFALENNNLIESADLVLDDTDHDQTTNAVAAYAAGGNFYTCGGVANTYTLTEVGNRLPIEALQDGMQFKFRVNIANTGASTLNINGLGAKAIVDKALSPLVNDFFLSGELIEVIYNLSNDNFEVLNKPAVICDFTTVYSIGHINQIKAGHIFELDEIAPGADLALFLFEDAGSLTTDSSGNGYTLTNNNAAIAADGITGSGHATELDGTNQSYTQATLLDSMTLHRTYSVDFWMDTDDYTPANNEYLFQKYYDANNYFGCYLSTTSTIVFEVVTNGSSRTLTAKLPNDEDYELGSDAPIIHVACCLRYESGSVGNICIFVNGQRAGEVNTADILSIAGNENFYIGQAQSGGTTYFDGKIMMMRVAELPLYTKSYIEQVFKKVFAAKFEVPNLALLHDSEIKAIIKTSDKDDIKYMTTITRTYQEPENDTTVSPDTLTNKLNIVRTNPIEVARDETNGYLYIQGRSFYTTDRVKIIAK